MGVLPRQPPNVLRYFPTQAFNFALKNQVKGLFPKYSPKNPWKAFAVNVVSGGLAGKRLAVFGVSTQTLPARNLLFVRMMTGA